MKCLSNLIWLHIIGLIFYIVGYSLLFPICILASFSSSIQFFAAMRFLIGLVSGGVTLVQFVYLQEIVGRSWWAITGKHVIEML